MVMRLLLSDEALEEFVHFLSTTESRNKIYRLIQYGAKMSKWVIMRACDLKAADLKEPIAQSAISLRLNGEKSLEERRPTSTRDSRTTPDSHTRQSVQVKEQARWVAVMLARVESLFGDARKVYRLFQFLEMLDLFRHVSDADATVRLLRKLRITCFFFFYLLENYMVFLLRIEGFAHRHPRVVMLKRSCNGFWCASIVLAFALDYVAKRGGALSTIKKLLDLPVAYLAFADQRVSDGLFGMLGIASAQIGVYLRWIEVMAKLRHKRLLARAGKKLLTVDLA